MYDKTNFATYLKDKFPTMFSESGMFATDRSDFYVKSDKGWLMLDFRLDYAYTEDSLEVLRERATRWFTKLETLNPAEIRRLLSVRFFGCVYDGPGFRFSGKTLISKARIPANYFPNTLQ